ncbi:hypothetical protein NKR23_g1498 [Pleurostoma richardsiae]|uniref:CFEM domain-containing protein n=1 Tax=Pleurostoma richardsiae TaxID=41990 RepID=A0AA38VWN8_9PEZI|nr:hypothetical protein NKR23_g1498 [Pleurostoma richardsiae]
MSLLKSAAVLLLVAGLVNTQSFADLPVCGQTCINNMRNSAASLLGCTDNTQLDSCICSNSNFQFGVRDCAVQNCGADEAPAVTNYASSFCGTATAAVAAATSSVVPAAAATATPTTTPLAETTEPPATSTTPTSQAVESVAQIPSSTSTSVNEVVAVTSTPVATPTSSPIAAITSATETSASSSTSVSSTTTSTSSSTATPAASQTESKSSSSSGLTTTAKIGIGIGAAVGAVIAVILAVFLCLRRRRAPLPRSRLMQISDPLPGSGRNYGDGGRHNADYKGGMSELELRSRPYEEMVPRQKPRQMV